MCFSCNNLVPALVLPAAFDSLPAFAVGIIGKATVILLAAFCLAALLRRASASCRHLVWSLAAVCLLLLPLAASVAPGWHVSWPAVEPSFRGGMLSTGGSNGAAVVPESASQSSAGLAAGQPGPDAASGNLRISALLGMWAAGFLLVAGRIGVGVSRFRRLAREARRLESPDWSLLSRQLASRLSLSAPPVLRSERTSIPMMAGFRSPVILLPVDCEAWPAERRWVVLAHEMLHARRGDYLLWMIARLACALYWFHPLAWMAASRLRREAEQACDDGVLHLGAAAPAYAEHLLSLARGWSLARAAAMSAMAMAQPSHLESRIRALLDPARNRRDLSRWTRLATAAAAILLLAPLAAVRAPAQAAASLQGTVSDASGARVPGARLLLRSVPDHSKAVGAANDAGEFAFDSLPAGEYVIEVRQPGFQLQQQSLTLQSGARESLAITLNLGAVVEEIVIVGKAPADRQPLRAGGPPRRIRVGGNVQRSKLLYEVRPAYPQELQREGVQGTVVLDAVIAADGSLKDLRLANDLDAVDERLVSAATEAVRFWRYEPTRLNGEPVEVLTSITLNFRLEP